MSEYRTVACCDPCWERRRHSSRPPFRLRHPEREVCGYCGEQTTSGIYVRASVSDLKVDIDVDGLERADR